MDVDKYLVAKFGQTQDKSIKRKVTVRAASPRQARSQARAFSDGTCSGLVQVWTAIKLNEVASSKRLSSGDRLDGVRKQASLALSIHQGGSKLGSLDQRTQGNARLDLTESDKGGISIYMAAAKAYSLGDVASKVKKGGKRQVYHLVVKFDGRLKGNHALGLYQSSGSLAPRSQHVYFFDPNFGEFKVPRHSFESFLSEFFKAKYADCSVGINALVKVSRVS